MNKETLRDSCHFHRIISPQNEVIIGQFTITTEWLSGHELSSENLMEYELTRSTWIRVKETNCSPLTWFSLQSSFSLYSRDPGRNNVIQLFHYAFGAPIKLDLYLQIEAHCPGTSPILECRDRDSFDSYQSHDAANYVGVPTEQCSKHKCCCHKHYHDCNPDRHHGEKKICLFDLIEPNLRRLNFFFVS